MKRPGLIILLLLLALVLRTAYGTTSFYVEDSLQVYLIGLKYFTTGLFPFWGPDVVYTQSQIPGALQGILVGAPFFIKAIPEAPFVFLNLFSVSVLCYFGWYLSKRIPAAPKWFLYGWLLSAPWTLYYSTKVENPSYVLPAAILFFVAVWELFPFYERPLMQRKWAFFWLGAGLFWVMQLHLSWVLMLPYIGLAFYFQLQKKESMGMAALFFLLGSALTFSTLAPALWVYGRGASNGSEQNIALNPDNLLQLFSIAGKFLAFAAGEVARFIGGTQEQLTFLKTYPWAAPFTIIFALLGLIQTGYLGLSFFLSKPAGEWRLVKWFTLGSIALLWLSYLFTTQPPKGHAFYILFPVAMWYSFYCYTSLLKYRYMPVIFAALLASGVIFHSALGMRNNAQTGLWQKRELVMQAIQNMDYTRIKLRRESAMEQANWEDVWETSASDSLSFHTSYEYKNPQLKPQNILGATSHSGQFCFKMDTIQPYGLSFREKMPADKTLAQCTLDCFLKGDFQGDIQTVLQLKSGKEGVFRASIPVRHEQFSAENWQPFKLVFEIPDSVKSFDQAEVYFWLSSKNAGVLLADDVNVKFSVRP